MYDLIKDFPPLFRNETSRLLSSLNLPPPRVQLEAHQMNRVVLLLSMLCLMIGLGRLCSEKMRRIQGRRVLNIQSRQHVFAGCLQSAMHMTVLESTLFVHA